METLIKIACHLTGSTMSRYSVLGSPLKDKSCCLQKLKYCKSQIHEITQCKQPGMQISSGYFD